MFVWSDEKQLAGDSANEVMVHEKARKPHTDLLQENPSASATNDEFKAIRGRLINFTREVAYTA